MSSCSLAFPGKYEYPPEGEYPPVRSVVLIGAALSSYGFLGYKERYEGEHCELCASMQELLCLKGLELVMRNKSTRHTGGLVSMTD